MRALKRGLVVVSMLGLWTVGAAEALRRADPAAVVVKKTGEVKAQREGRTLPVTVGFSLEPGDRLLVPAGAQAVLLYRTGKMATETGNVTIEARESEQVGRTFQQAAQTLTQVATTNAARQPNRQGMIRPAPGMAQPIAPRNDVAVMDVRPGFTWFAVPGAESYTIQLQRTDLAGARPERFQVGGDTTWAYPAAAPPLVPGASYRWTVAAGASGRPAAMQSFRVIGAAEYAALAERLSTVSASGVDPMGDGLFLTALWYRDAGLFYEADRALARMAADGTGGGRIFHLLRGEVWDRLGELERASEAFQAADREGA